MKKITTIISIMICISQFSLAQTWNTTGNAGTTPGTNFIGTTDAKDFVFKTNSTEKGRVKTNGLWQFGASGNLAKIDSAGNLSFAGTAFYKVAGNKYAFQYAGNPNYGLFFNSTDLLYEFRTSTALSVFSIGSNSGNGIFKGNLKVGAYTLPSTDGTSGQVLKTNGSGILSWSADSDNDAQTLSLAGNNLTISNGNSVTLPSGTTYTAGFGIGLVGNVIANTAPDQIVSLTGTGGTTITGAYPNWTINSQTGSSQWTTSGSNIYYNTGKVGIGITSPTSLLEISSSQPDAKIGITNSANFGRLLFAQSGTIFSSVQQIGSTYSDVNRQNALELMNLTASGPISFFTGGSERMRINSSGNVSMTGNLTVTGNLNLGGTVVNSLTVDGASSFLRMNASNSIGADWSLSNDGYYSYVNCVTGTGTGIIANFANTTEPYQFTVWGNMQANGFISNSDRKLKTNIQSLDKVFSAIDVVKKLNPVTYDFKTEEYKIMNLPSNKQYGFIAQEIQQVLPSLVTSSNMTVAKDENGNPVKDEVLSVNYLGVIPVLTEAIKEQQQTIDDKTAELETEKKLNADQQNQIESLNSKLDEMLNKMNNFETSLSQCCSSYQNSKQTGTQNPKPETPSLEQNIPNPFLQNCYIKFYIPSSAKNSSIVVSDLNGRVVKTFANLSVGFGTVNINGGELAAGIYNYSLFIDAMKVDTKEMVLTK